MWRCIPIAVATCLTITPIPHMGRFLAANPLPQTCEDITGCHYVWEPGPTPLVYDHRSPQDEWPTVQSGTAYSGWGNGGSRRKRLVVECHIPPHHDDAEECTKPRPVPEPATWMVLIVALFGVVLVRKTSAN